MANDFLSIIDDPAEHPLEGDDLPKYSDPGWIIFEVIKTPNEPDVIEVWDYDSHGSTFWLNEGMGCDYFLEHFYTLDIEMSGVYVMEGVTGDYIRGDGYIADDDEDWYFGLIRRASPEEIKDSDPHGGEYDYGN